MKPDPATPRDPANVGEDIPRLTKVQRRRLSYLGEDGLLPPPLHRQWRMYETLEQRGLILREISRPGFVRFFITPAGRAALQATKP